MTTPELTRASVTARMQANHAALGALIAGRSEAELRGISPVTPEWNAFDILLHIWVWGELCARCLQDWLGGRDWMLTFASEDQFNLEMVEARAQTDLATVAAGIEAAYAAYAAALRDCDDGELAQVAPAPWGTPLTRLQMIDANLGHDQEHIEQLAMSQG